MMAEIITHFGAARPSSDTSLVLHVIADSCEDVGVISLQRETIQISLLGDKSNLVTSANLHEISCEMTNGIAFNVMATRARGSWGGHIRIIHRHGNDESDSERFIADRNSFLRIDHRHRWLGELDLRTGNPTFRLPAENQVLAAALADRQSCRSKVKFSDDPIMWVARAALLAADGDCGTEWEYARLDTFEAR